MSQTRAERPRPGLSGSRILFLNWRCPWHPQAGGAEEYCWNVATQFAKAGAEVTLATSRPSGLSGDEMRSGVHIRRRGGTFTVYLWAALFVLWRGHTFSALFDCQNGIPFFAPLFLLNRSVPVLLVIHHVHQDQFTLRFGWPMAAFGRVLEGQVSRLIYGRRPIVAVSPGTRAEVRRRLKLKGPIYVVPNGISPPAADQRVERSETPSIVYVGRLVAHKRLHLLLKAVVPLQRCWPDLRVDIAGSGPARLELEQLVMELGLRHIVRFWGLVSDEQRTQLLASAWMLVTPSAGEGWGLTVIEANAVGRPAVACRVPGLVNSIVPGVNGWLVDDVNGFSHAIDAALLKLSDVAETARFETSCRRWAAQFSWERAAQRMAHIMDMVPRELVLVQPRRRIREASDAATVVVLEATAGLDRLYERLLPSDLWRIEGRTLSILLEGHDVSTAIASLEQLGLSGNAVVRVARTSDLLLGFK